MMQKKPPGNGPRFTMASLILVLVIIIPAAAITLSPGDTSGTTPVIAKGDPVYINGIATGRPVQGLQVWLIGTNYVRIASVSVNDDSTYSYELKPAETQQLASGQYVVLIQHPMMNGRFDIVYNSATGDVTNLISGQKIFQLTGSGSLPSPAGANALIQAINSQNIDDTFASTTFLVSSPDALITPIGDHFIGDRFTIGGSTNLAPGNDLLVEIYSSSFSPTKKTQASGFSGTSGTVPVTAGTGGSNLWTFDVDTSGWKADEYIVTVSGVSVEVTRSEMFRLLEPIPTTPVPVVTTITEVPTTLPPETPMMTTVPVESPAPTRSPVSVFTVTGSIALLAVAWGVQGRK